MQSVENTARSSKFDLKDYGAMEDWAAFMLPHPRLGTVPGKHFLHSELGLTGMEVSLNSLPPGKAIPFLHGHRQNEELYLFLAGQGQMLLDGTVVEVRSGTAVRVSTPVLRSWRNTGDVPLVCVVIQAKEGSLLQMTIADGFLGESPPAWPA